MNNLKFKSNKHRLTSVLVIYLLVFKRLDTCLYLTIQFIKNIFKYHAIIM